VKVYFDGFKMDNTSSLTGYFLGVTKFDITCEFDTTSLFINKSWVEVKQVRVIFELT